MADTSMTDNRTYCFLHLRGPGRDVVELRTRLLGEVFPAWRQDAVVVWGVWSGLFGVASNELLVVAAAADQRSIEDFTQALGGIEMRDSLLLSPTVRPADDAPRAKAGLYVFRFFDVANPDVAEVVRLSAEAWKTFENTSAYQSEPQGLFSQSGATGVGRMLLVTWYDGLESWQTSRRPAPEAMDNFLRRRELTRGTVALATSLVTDWS